MSLLTPLGLIGLGLIGLLILIYIIKPNFQSKFIPSTFVWRLSLKYKKKRIPISKLRNIIIFICQVIILACVAMVLAQPYIDNSKEVEDGDTVMILDTSASMHATYEGKTRFARAVAQMRADAAAAFENGNKVTVIVAGESAYFASQQVVGDNAEIVYTALDSMLQKPDTVYTYGTADLNGAMALAEQITSLTDKVTVTLYTDTEYYNSGDVIIHNVTQTLEWNAAILDVRMRVVENYYRMEIDVASYGKDDLVLLDIEIQKPNGMTSPLKLKAEAYCAGDEVTTYTLAHIADPDSPEAAYIDQAMELYSYDQIIIKIAEQDALSYDNQYYLYGGTKPTMKILYYSPLPNNYFTSVLLLLQDELRDSWNIVFDEVSTGDPIIEGYDLYIYEHTMPKTMPSDGVVLCVNPKSMPSSTGIKFSGIASSPGAKEVFLEPAETHPMMNNIDPSAISVTQFSVISSYSDYTPLMTVKDRQGEYPMLLVKNEIDAKIVVLPFSLHYSNLILTPEFPMLMLNMMNYFFPTTTDRFVFEAGETVELNSRGHALEVTGPGLELTLKEFPGELTVKKPGTYTLIQYPISGKPVVESVYVKIPAAESNIRSTEGVLENPYFYSDSDAMNIDLLFYFALTMVALLFIEWWLKSREQI